MSSRVLMSHVQFQCPLCRDVLSEPVSIPCGHSFCFRCITSHWDQAQYVSRPRGQAQGVSCPRCHSQFSQRPQLCENNFLRDMSNKIKASSSSLLQEEQKEQEISCDVCIEGHTQAVRSCLVCLASFCGPHLEPHCRVPTLRAHSLVPPVGALESRLCKRHQRLLELFCRREEECVCVLCAEAGHQGHLLVPVERRAEEVKEQVELREEEVQLRIQEKLRRKEEVSYNIIQSREQSRQDLQEARQVFSSLVAQVKEVGQEVEEEIQRAQEEAELRAQKQISELQQEVRELRRRRQELELLRQSQDHLQLVQAFSSLSPLAPPLGRSVPVHADPSLGAVRSAVERVEEELQEILQVLCAREIQRMQKFSVDVRLDPRTANPWLRLSEDRRAVWDGDQEQYQEQDQDQEETPERFDTAPCVLGDKAFSSGRQYWEVEVGGKTAWDVGVACASVVRKGVVTLSPADGFWTLCLREGGQYRACAGEAQLLPLLPPFPRVVAVFLDHEGGRVSFYDPEVRGHLYSYTGFSFTQDLLPFFNPETSTSGGHNTAPLVLRGEDQLDLDNVLI
ncbi:unnamed protein product [Knipowitschia caucasica]